MLTGHRKKLNSSQREAIKHKDGPLLIIAGAGTGKTTVITERILNLVSTNKALPSEILALTFTDKAAEEMQERVDIAMPYGYSDMWISTFHSFCDRVLRSDAIHIGIPTDYSLLTEAESIALVREKIYEFNFEYFRPVGNPTKFVEALLAHFSRLQDECVTPEEYIKWANSVSFPRLPAQAGRRESKKIDSGSEAGMTEEEKLEIKKNQELAKAYETYQKIKLKENVFDFGDLIIKTIELFEKRPNVLRQYQDKFKYLLIDEFQDTNYAQNKLALLLAGYKANITVVGDDDQCLPAYTNITTKNGIKKIKNIKTGDEVLTAVGKGHLSYSKVLHINKSLKKASFLTFTTESGEKITATDNHKFFCMIPGRKLTNHEKIYLYLMCRKGIGWRLGITNDLAQRLKLERSAGKIIAIKACATLEEARFFESVYSMKYQIPTYPFMPRKKMLLTGPWLKRLFGEFETEKNAINLAKDLNIDLDSYHYCLDAVYRGEKERIKIVLNMCQRKYVSKYRSGMILAKPFICHAVYLETSSERVREILLKNGVLYTKAKKGIRIRKQFSDLTEAYNFSKKLCKLISGTVEVRFNLAKIDKRTRSSLVMPAKNVLEGMHIPIVRGSEILYEKVVNVQEKTEKRFVYDLEIEKTHNFVANNVVVHNSIYKFRGAAISNILSFKDTFPNTKIVVLNKNYRSFQNILDASYRLISFNNPDRLEIHEGINKKLSSTRGPGKEIVFIHRKRDVEEADAVAEEIKKLVESEKYEFKDFAILVRANSHATIFFNSLSLRGIPYQFLGPNMLFAKPEIVAITSYLKVLEDKTNNLAFYNLLSMEELNVPNEFINNVLNKAKKNHLNLYDLVYESEEKPEAVTKLLSVLDNHLKNLRNLSPTRALYEFLEKMGVINVMTNTNNVETQKRATNITAFFDKARRYELTRPEVTLSSFLSWVEISSELGESALQDTQWSEENAVNILTVHSAKGLEFPVVFMVNLVSQRFPSNNKKEALPIPQELIKEKLPSKDFHKEEERRLFYVGMTRAKDKLYFSAADFYGDAKRPKKISEFVFETLGDKAVKSEEEGVKSQQLSLLDFSSKDSLPTTRSSPLHIHYLSYSQIDTFKMCPLHYKLSYILKVPSTPSASLSLGTSIHETIRSFYENIKKGEKANKKLLYNLLDENWISEGYINKKHIEDGYENARRMLMNFYKTEKPFENLPEVIEQKFTVPLYSKNEEPLLIGGKIDRVDILSDGKIEILDYKTGSIPSGGQKEIDKNLQLTFYALAAVKNKEFPFDKKPEEIILTLWFLNENKKFKTTRNIKELENAEKEIFKIRKEIEESDFKCSNHPMCANCEYKTFCRQE